MDITINILPEWEKGDTICKDTPGGYFLNMLILQDIKGQVLLAKYITALRFRSDVGTYLVTKTWCYRNAKGVVGGHLSPGSGGGQEERGASLRGTSLMIIDMRKVKEDDSRYRVWK